MTIGMNNLGANGRLGNQMFQYASLVGIAKNKGYDFRIPDHSKVDRFYYHNGHTNISEHHELQHCFEMLHCGDRYGLIDGDEVELHDSHEFCEELFKECPNHVSLNGYFQTEKYFKNAEKLIRLDFRFKKELIEKVRNMYGKYLEQKPVALVVRHFKADFDYDGCEKAHRNLPISYFKKGIEMMGKDRTYIVCSNDIELCKTVFEGSNFIFADTVPENTNKGHFDLCLMSMCQDFIIPNSTFAWWGAWLGTGENKKVIAPEPWYGPALADINTDDLYPSDWIKIKE